MNFRPYLMAADCPVCGDKDAADEWRGARTSASYWGHDFPCCSDKCGYALANLLRQWSPQKIAGLRRKMQNQSETRLW